MSQSERVSKSFVIMVVGQIISIFGASLLRFGLSLYVLDKTGREDIFAALLAISSIPLLFAPVGGAIADRVNRRNLMVFIDTANSIIVLIFILCLQIGISNIPIIAVMMVLLGIIGMLEQPTVQASVPALVPESKLEGANGIVSGVGAISGLIAPIAGGFLYSLYWYYQNNIKHKAFGVNRSEGFLYALEVLSMPMKPKRPCSSPGCPELTHGRYCAVHQKMADQQYEKYQRDPATRKHYGRTWKRIRDRYIAAHPTCEECNKAGRLTPAEEVHHIHPLSRGGTHAETNLMSLCTSCHSEITAREGGRWG